MAELTARLTAEAWETFHRLSRDHGLTLRSMAEASGVGLLDLEERVAAGNASEAEGRLLEAIWASAGHQDQEAATGGLSRRKLNLRTDDALLARMRAACARRGVTLTSLITTMVSPWGSGWAPDDDVYAARGALWCRIVTTARRMDYERRTGGPVTLECATS